MTETTIIMQPVKWTKGSRANDIFVDVTDIVLQAVVMANGTIFLDDGMALEMPETLNGILNNENSFYVSASRLLQSSYPNIRFSHCDNLCGEVRLTITHETEKELAIREATLKVARKLSSRKA